MKALGRGISAPPGLRSFTFRVGEGQTAAAEAVSQQQQQQQQADHGGLYAQHYQSCEPSEGDRDAPPAEPAVAAAAAALVELDAPQDVESSESSSMGGSRGSSRGSTSCSSKAGGIQFSTVASDSRRWCFALLQPAPCHVAALCVEDASADCCSSPEDCSADSGSCEGDGHGSLRLRSFTVQPAALLGSSSWATNAADPCLLAQGTTSPC